MKRLTMCILIIGLTNACASKPKAKKCEPYTWNGALTEVLRAGDPTRPRYIPKTSPDLSGPYRHVTRVCSSMPIFGMNGEFVRYHVECR